MSMEHETLTTENRLLAALAHSLIVANGLGSVAGMIIYVNQREKSKFVAFQALQAAVYQVISLVAVIAMWVVWTIFYVLTLIPLMRFPERYEDAPPPIFWIGLASMIIPMLIMAVIGLYGLWGAVQTWRGKDFRYAGIGGWLERSGLWNKG